MSNNDHGQIERAKELIAEVLVDLDEQTYLHELLSDSVAFLAEASELMQGVPDAEAD